MSKPRIDFCFQGWVRGAEISTALDIATGNTIDVSEMSSEELVGKIKNGELAISFDDCLENSSNQEIELFDYEESTTK